MKYKAVIGDDFYDLEKKVNKLILEGYVPIGGICKYENFGQCLQAMIKTT